ncbi:MAG: hypothetical protein P8Y23_14190, partial [Candidatus Lokiarchaeota archaeon]
MPKLAIINFSVDFSAYFVLPRNYIKDLIHLLETMERYGYIIQKRLSLAKSYIFSINLNYFKESYQVEEIINPKSKKYSKDYEIEFKMEFHGEFKNFKLSILDFLIIEAIRFRSNSNNFSRIKLSNDLKSDLSLLLSNEYKNLEELESINKVLIYSPNLINEFIYFLGENEKKGFFYIK